MTSPSDGKTAFIAPTAQAIRQYMRGAFRGGLQNYDRVVLPLCGRLQLAEMAVDAGWRVFELECSDTNLWSAILGSMAAGKDLADLGIDFQQDHEWSDWARTKVQGQMTAAAVGLLLKLAPLNPHVTADRLFRDELWANRDHYSHQLQAGAQRLAEKLRGIDFKVADVFGVVSAAANDERALVYVGVPSFYGKPFACVGERGNSKALITWNAPVIAPFEARTGLDKLHHDLMPGNALAFFHWPERAIADPYRDKSVFVHDHGSSREHILCNRPDEARLLVKARKETDVKPAPYPMLPVGYDAETPAVAQVVPCSKESALYYTDLWGVALGGGRVGRCFLVMINGMVAAVFGINFADIRTSRGPWVTLTFAAYPKCHQWWLEDVLPAVLTSQQAWQVFESIGDAPLYELSEIRVDLIDSPQQIDKLLAAWEAVDVDLAQRERLVDGRDHAIVHGRIKQWENPFSYPLKAMAYDDGTRSTGWQKLLAGTRPFPDVILQHGPSSLFRVTDHPDFQAAKAGDRGAAQRVVAAALTPEACARVAGLINNHNAVLVPVRNGFNALPVVYAQDLGERLGGVPVDEGLVQVNRAERSGKDAIYRLVHRAAFNGPIHAGKVHVLVDDMVTQGGTFAELRSWIVSQGGAVLGCTALTGAPYSHVLYPRADVLAYARNKFQGLDDWWQATMGYPLACLTDSEAYSLGRFATLQALQERVAAALSGVPELRTIPRVPWPESVDFSAESVHAAEV